MKRLVMDLDGTITHEEPGVGYADKRPNLEIIARIRDYKAMGFTIIIQTARNMRSFENSVGLINAHTLPVVIDWLRRHEVPYDEIHVGKPWCGKEGFYVDDRAIRPDEFLTLNPEQIAALIGPTSAT
jgi:capsule biosynthesis phosphatase